MPTTFSCHGVMHRKGRLALPISRIAPKCQPCFAALLLLLHCLRVAEEGKHAVIAIRKEGKAVLPAACCGERQCGTWPQQLATSSMPLGRRSTWPLDPLSKPYNLAALALKE